ncbi:hypothetical protein GE09DRAFT_1285883 [Coniochaeta sp. 2T2.1]|nr:hypothetical protein GE09DRAFT_1285883 [Coniochaeta sp. 2T2.1]
MNTIVTILTDPTQAYNLGRDATARSNGTLSTASMRSYAKYVRDIFQSMKDKMAVPANLDIELMCSDTWLAPTDPKGKPHPQPGYFWDSRTNPGSRPNAAVNGWIYTGVDGKCTPGDTGFTITQMWETTWDVITFCQSQFRNWIEQHQNRDTLQHVCAAPAPQGMRIDVLMDDKLARTVVHELSHSVNAVGQGFHNEDGAYVSPIDDQPEGYGFFNVIKLADKPELAVKNADSYSYFAAAVYCSRNNWSDGWAKANDITFEEWTLDIDGLSTYICCPAEDRAYMF